MKDFCIMLGEKNIIATWSEFTKEYEFYKQVKNRLGEYIIKLAHKSVPYAKIVTVDKDTDKNITYQVLNAEIKYGFKYKQLVLKDVIEFMKYFHTKPNIKFNIVICNSCNLELGEKIEKVLKQYLPDLKWDERTQYFNGNIFLEYTMSKEKAYEIYTLLSLRNEL